MQQAPVTKDRTNLCPLKWGVLPIWMMMVMVVVMVVVVVEGKVLCVI